MEKLENVFSALSATEYMICSKGVAIQGEPEDSNYVVIYDREQNEEHGMHYMKRVYRILPDNDLEEVNIDKMICEVKDAIRNKVDTEELLEQMLRTGGPHSLVRAHTIISKYPEVKEQIRTRRGCLFLDIPDPTPGKEGAKLYLRM